jgi:hypothetical protein
VTALSLDSDGEAHRRVLDRPGGAQPVEQTLGGEVGSRGGRESRGVGPLLTVTPLGWVSISCLYYCLSLVTGFCAESAHEPLPVGETG